MNNRDYKILSKGGVYHLFNRGVGKMDIFNNEKDMSFFISRLKENLFPEMVPISKRKPSPGGYLRKLLPPGCFTLLAYCLMPNHFHFAVRQNTEMPISKFILKICGSYSKYFNLEYKRVGSLFQDQYKAVRVESDPQLLWLSAYIHLNPAVSGLVKNLTDYPYSSYLDYIGLRRGTLCEKDLILKEFANQEAYRKFVDDAFLKIKERKEIEYLFLED